MSTKLTKLARGAGCGCKLGKDVLLDALKGISAPLADAAVLVGPSGLDDGCVYQLRDDLAIVASVDFFTPVVDDPETFGAIAATNALSDLYAMGATPTLALAVCAYPKEGDLDALAAILRGGAQTALAHGCPVLGGHSIDDPEPKYGLAVIGTAHPERLLINAGATVGDVLILTKPLGLGILATARAAGAASAQVGRSAEVWMLQSNRAASEAALAANATAATDVTGYGLLGHLHELCVASGVGAEIDAPSVPIIDGVLELARSGHVSGGLRRNASYVASDVDTDDDVDPVARLVFADPQTSGGLLIAVSPEGALLFEEASRVAGLDTWRIGRVVGSPVGRIVVHGQP